MVATRLQTGEQAVLAPLDDHGSATDDHGSAPNDLGSATNWPLKTARRALLSDVAMVDGDGQDRVFLRPYNPPPRLILIGAVHIAQHLVGLGKAVGFDTVVIDPREAFAKDFRFPGVELIRTWPDEALRELAPGHRTAIAVLTHDPKLDDPALTEALSGGAFYVGALGSRRTNEQRLERLRGKGVSDEALALLHAPIGLPIGASSPAEIALAIMAEIVQTLRSS